LDKNVQIITTRECLVVVRSVASVCLCVCLSVCKALTLSRKFIFGMRNLQIKFVYQGHRVKVKVTGAMESHPATPSVTNMVQSRCQCSDGKSISVIPACSHEQASSH